MSEDLLKELRELEVGTFEIEDVAEVGVYAADDLMPVEELDAFGTSCSSSSCSTGSTSSCSTSCTSSTCSTCSCC